MALIFILCVDFQVLLINFHTPLILNSETVFISSASQLKKQFNELVNSFRMAWKLVRSSLSQNGNVYFLKYVYIKQI